MPGIEAGAAEYGDRFVDETRAFKLPGQLGALLCTLVYGHLLVRAAQVPVVPAGAEVPLRQQSIEPLVEPASELLVGPDRGHGCCVAEIFHVVVVERVPGRQLKRTHVLDAEGEFAW